MDSRSKDPVAGPACPPPEAAGEQDRRSAAEAGCRLVGPIAASRHARVFGARADDRPLVLKVRADGLDPIGRARFEREGRVGLSLHHPNLTQTLACTPDWILLRDLRGVDGTPARRLDRVVLDRVALDGALRQGSEGDAPAEVSVPTLSGIADALAHMHARGLVHRDVKPGNILYDPTGRAVLIDLGLVGLIAGDDLGRDELTGSPAWMAPEQLAGWPPRPSADVYAFALVVALALCGLPGFDGGAAAVLRHRSSGGGPDAAFRRRLRGVPASALKALVTAGLSEDPGMRPPIHAFGRALRAAEPTCPRGA